jgi:hypothetical protein
VPSWLIGAKHGSTEARASACDAAAAAMAAHVADFEAYLKRFHPSVVDAKLRWDQLG